MDRMGEFKAGMNDDEYKKLILGLSDVNFEGFKVKLLGIIDEECQDIRGTISNEHLAELGFNGEGINYHSLNIEYLKNYLKKIEVMRDNIENMKA